MLIQRNIYIPNFFLVMERNELLLSSVGVLGTFPLISNPGTNTFDGDFISVSAPS
jgi:hypothetical protein